MKQTDDKYDKMSNIAKKFKQCFENNMNAYIEITSIHGILYSMLDQLFYNMKVINSLTIDINQLLATNQYEGEEIYLDENSKAELKRYIQIGYEILNDMKGFVNKYINYQENN